MGAALKRLASKAQSEAELRDWLERRHRAKAQTVDECVNRLREMGLIEDRRFAEAFARSRLSVKPVGRARLAQQLAARKVGRDSVNAALDAVFESEREAELIDLAIRRHARLHGRPRDRRAVKRLFDHLARRGFDFELIRSKLRSLSSSTREDDEF
jgi:regulatory protein